MNPNDTTPNGADPRAARNGEPYRPTPADMLHQLGEAADEVHSLREENAALTGALKLLTARNESQVNRLEATLTLRTQTMRRMAAMLAKLASEACPILRRYLCYLDVGELPTDPESLRMTREQVLSLLLSLEPNEQQK